MTELKKILFLINKFKRGGAERVFLNHVNYLHEKGHEVFLGVVFASIEERNFFNELKIPAERVIVFGFQNIYDWSKLKELDHFVKEKGIRIVYSTLEDANILARLIRIGNKGLKVFVRESGMADRKSLKNRLFDLVLNFWSHRIIAVSETVAASLRRYQAIHRRKILVLPNFVNLPETSSPEEGQSDSEEFVVMNVGSMKNDNKGQLEIIKAVEVLRENPGSRRIKLVLVGDGKMRVAYEKYVADKGLAGIVEFTGIIDTEQVSERYRSANLYVQFSQNEGCANTVLEACSFALPVITTPVGGVDGLVIDQVNGFVLKERNIEELSEKIKYFLDNPKKSRQFGEAGYEIVKKEFTIEKKTEELLRIFEA